MQLYNTLSRKKELFKPLKSKNVSLYVCGITPYDTTHLGHAFTYIFFDTFIRYLRYKNYTVVYTQNVTDINDRDNDILKRAKEQNIAWQELARFWTQQFLRDMDILNWQRPTHYLKASEQIPSMTNLMQKIIKNGYGYVVNGGVYLDISKRKDFGKLSQLNHEQMRERAKIFDEDIQNPDKRHPLDITLWRPSSPDQPKHIPVFASPYGQGRPGWHLECSAMSISSLGNQIDIHGGGSDLIYPHHESEIAQSESATRKKPFAKYWLHTGTVMYEGEKMSKSLGNLILVKDVLKKYSPNAIRWLLLSHHYRQPWEYYEHDMKDAQKIADTIASALTHVQEKETTNEYLKDVSVCLEDDFNTPHVLQRIEDFVGDKENAEALQAAKQLTSVLGFTF